jgi:hypothetical protein
MENNSVYCNQLLVDCFQANNSTRINSNFNNSIDPLPSHLQFFEA